MRINSIGPDGVITFRDAPFTLSGNRGAIDNGRTVTTSHKGHRWIYCLTGALRHPEEFMDGGSVTDLFFLDEATALAAGHRPCHQCNGTRAKQFEQAWASANLGDASLVGPIDLKLMDDRLTSPKAKKTFTTAVTDLPTGAIIRLLGEPFLLATDMVYPWSSLGYGVPRDLPRGEVEVLTPSSTIQVMKQPMFKVSLENLIMRW